MQQFMLYGLLGVCLLISLIFFWRRGVGHRIWIVTVLLTALAAVSVPYVINWTGSAFYCLAIYSCVGALLLCMTLFWVARRERQDKREQEEAAYYLEAETEGDVATMPLEGRRVPLDRPMLRYISTVYTEEEPEEEEEEIKAIEEIEPVWEEPAQGLEIEMEEGVFDPKTKAEGIALPEPGAAAEPSTGRAWLLEQAASEPVAERVYAAREGLVAAIEAEGDVSPEVAEEAEDSFVEEVPVEEGKIVVLMDEMSAEQDVVIFATEAEATEQAAVAEEAHEAAKIEAEERARAAKEQAEAAAQAEARAKADAVARAEAKARAEAAARAQAAQAEAKAKADAAARAEAKARAEAEARAQAAQAEAKAKADAAARAETKAKAEAAARVQAARAEARAKAEAEAKAEAARAEAKAKAEEEAKAEVARAEAKAKAEAARVEAEAKAKAEAKVEAEAKAEAKAEADAKAEAKVKPKAKAKARGKAKADAKADMEAEKAAEVTAEEAAINWGRLIGAAAVSAEKPSARRKEASEQVAAPPEVMEAEAETEVSDLFAEEALSPWSGVSARPAVIEEIFVVPENGGELESAAATVDLFAEEEGRAGEASAIEWEASFEPMEEISSGQEDIPLEEDAKPEGVQLIDRAFAHKLAGRWGEAADAFLAFRRTLEDAPGARKQADIECLGALHKAGRLYEAVDLVFSILSSDYALSATEREQVEAILTELRKA